MFDAQRPAAASLGRMNPGGARFYVTMDDGGSVLGFASDGLERDLDTAARSARLPISLVRVDLPLPAGSAPAQVTVVERFEPQGQG
jgi:hypothetical protein